MFFFYTIGILNVYDYFKKLALVRALLSLLASYMFAFGVVSMWKVDPNYVFGGLRLIYRSGGVARIEKRRESLSSLACRNDCVFDRRAFRRAGRKYSFCIYSITTVISIPPYIVEYPSSIAETLNPEGASLNVDARNTNDPLVSLGVFIRSRATRSKNSVSFFNAVPIPSYDVVYSEISRIVS